MTIYEHKTLKSFSPSRFWDVPLKSSFHFVVCEEGHVAGVSDGQDLPVAKKRRPRLEKSAIESMAFLNFILSF